MKLLRNKYFIFGGFVILAVTGYFYFVHKPPHEQRQRTAFSDLKCPDDYKTDKERNDAFDDFVSYYYEFNPSGSLDYLLDSRKEFYIRHNCTEALKKLDDYESGKIDPKTKQEVERVIGDTFGR